ncbi:inositol-3-phosphate synthase [Anaeromyxobacter dehalogenans]|uniref:Inositol-3-phosphate synthase n=1 Tax=Anaeromyxobacter dehalogenans (strain 2CP-C) TaxID=290397 RepID=Q2II29_ANADE|nr:inositol-3-phosphate synthase [Anaeromyxobacter dehalogenans]ABC81308.1 Inositol-3-phosphate synthase [Anaeromyxobacter dehalogenans 2CP-C]
MRKPRSIAPAKGRLAVLVPGLGAVATTLIAGVEAVKRGMGKPIGSLTQMGTVRLGKRTEKRAPLVRELVPIAALEDVRFGAWDPFPDDAYASATHASVLDHALLEQLRVPLSAVRPMPAVFSPEYVRRLDGPNVKKAPSKLELGEALREDIRRFLRENDCARAVMLWCASTEVYLEPSAVHAELGRFEKAMAASDPAIAPSMIYAWAALKEGVAFGNGAPNLTVDVPALQQLAKKQGVPIAGKDFKTGQTMMKTVLAPMLKARLLALNGWFSTNILGNRDGEVLDDPGSFKTKEVSKLSALQYILQPELYPDLYGHFDHQVHIEYYKPRGDNKEGWDNVDIAGWLGYPMQIKVNFLCRDSILAAPVALDVALFLDLAQRAGMSGIQEWLSFYFKSPMVAEGLYPEHDLFIQLTKLKNTLRHLAGEELITHLGLDYYEP